MRHWHQRRFDGVRLKHRERSQNTEKSIGKKSDNDSKNKTDIKSTVYGYAGKHSKLVFYAHLLCFTQFLPEIILKCRGRDVKKYFLTFSFFFFSSSVKSNDASQWMIGFRTWKMLCTLQVYILRDTRINFMM